MKKFLLAGIVAAAFCGAPALAVDAPVKATPATMFNWTGFYVGVQGGYGWGPSRFYNVGGPIGLFGTYDIKGGAVGGTLGYNYQIGSVVIGLEGDMSWADIKGTGTTGAVCAPINQCNTKIDEFGTARARIGYAFGNVLPYVTGGIAFGRLRGTLPILCSLINCTASTTRTVGTIGGGVEAAVGKGWSAKFEYLYFDLGKVGFPVSVGSDFTEGKVNLLRLGLNYRFGSQ